MMNFLLGAEPGNIFCPHCGATVPPVGDAFCPDCWNELSEIPDSKSTDAVDVIAAASSEPDDAGAGSSPPSPVEDGLASKLFVGAILILVGAFLLWSLASVLLEGYWSLRLACAGVPVWAKVLAYQPERVTHRTRRGGSHTYVFHMHRVSFHDRVETVKLNGKYPVGAEVYVLYLPETEGIATAYSPSDSAFTILRSRIHGNTCLWLLLWVKLTVLGVLSWLFPGKDVEGTAGALLDSAAQAAVADN